MLLIPHRGAGMVVPLIGILFALVMNIVAHKLLDPDYYQDHKWPKLAVLVASGLCCLVLGLFLKNKRKQYAHVEQQPLNSSSGKYDPLEFPTRSYDHLFYIPVEYWSIPYVFAAVLYAYVGK